MHFAAIFKTDFARAQLTSLGYATQKKVDIVEVNLLHLFLSVICRENHEFQLVF
jgi:hypothetical protein